MHVTGGTYFESCSIPDYDALYGSGLRGVAAIGNLTDTPNHLHTCAAAGEESTLKAYAPAYAFDHHITRVPTTVQFEYLHSLATPTYFPADAADYNKQLGPIEANTILRYGMVEGTSTVKGEQVVYDPQSADPEPFHANGSTAERLALVLNQPEARALTGETTTDAMLEELTTGPETADVVVLKCGSAGALVRRGKDTHEIPVFQIDSVWPIGSGDVFTAVFAAYWAELGDDPEGAAYEASLATAYYCNTTVLPVPEEPRSVADFDPTEKPAYFDDGHPTIYLAGPFFSIGQLWFVNEVRRILQDRGATVFSPYHDVGHVVAQEGEREVAQADLAAIDECDVVFALLDEIDPGTYFELGYARRAGKPVIVYQNESEQRRQTMLKGTDCTIYDELASAVHKVLLQYR